MYNGWFIEHMSNMRDAIASDADIIAMMATIIAGFVIVVRMVGFHYKLSSDEVEEGFGGNVKAWDFLRPVVLLLLISQAPGIGRTINTVVTGCTNSICADNELQTLKVTHRLNKEKKIQEYQQRIEQTKASLASFANNAPDPDIAGQMSYAANNGMLSYDHVKEEEIEHIDKDGNVYYSYKCYYKVYALDSFHEAITTEEVAKEFPDKIKITQEDYVEYARRHPLEMALKESEVIREIYNDTSNELKNYKRQKAEYERQVKDINQITSLDEMYQKYGTPEATLFEEYIKYPYPPFPDFFEHKWSWRSPFRSLWNAAKDAATYIPRLIWYIFRVLIAVIINAIYSALIWLFENIILIRAFMANIAMCVMLFFFPLVFFAMLFPSHRDAFGSWTVIFIELALWFPLGTIVMHIANYAVLNITELGLADSLWYMVVLVAGILTMWNVSEYAKMALTAFGRHGEVPSSGGFLLTAAAGATALGKGMAKMPAQKMLLNMKTKRQEKKNVKTSMKISKKCAKVESQDKSIRETRMALAREARADKAAFNATVAGGGGVRAAAPKWKAYKKDMKSIKQISEHHARVMKPVAKQKAKLLAGQQALKQLQKQSKHFYLKQIGKLVARTANVQAISQMDNIVKGDSLVTSTDAKRFVKKTLGATLTKTFKIGKRASITIRKKAKQAAVFAKNASGPLKNSVRNRAKKVAELVSQAKGKLMPDREKVGTGKLSKYAKVGGNPNTHTARFSKVKKAKKARNRQSSHSRMRNLKKHK